MVWEEFKYSYLTSHADLGFRPYVQVSVEINNQHLIPSPINHSKLRTLGPPLFHRSMLWLNPWIEQTIESKKETEQSSGHEEEYVVLEGRSYSKAADDYVPLSNEEKSSYYTQLSPGRHLATFAQQFEDQIDGKE